LIVVEIIDNERAVLSLAGAEVRGASSEHAVLEYAVLVSTSRAGREVAVHELNISPCLDAARPVSGPDSLTNLSLAVRRQLQLEFAV
jgi:hypothetical protein